MSHVVAETSMFKYIKNGISNKINKALNFVLSNNQELKAVNAKQLLYEGIWYGRSYHEDRRIQTFTEQKAFGDNWIIDEL